MTDAVRWDPERTALLVIDMQNGFCDPAGSVARSGLDVTPMAGVVDPVVQLVDAVRDAGVRVIFTRYWLAEDWSDAGLLSEVSPALREAEGLIRGTWDAELVAALAPRPDELIVDKTRYSAFWGTALAADLRRWAIDRVLLCGVTTNVCVEGTARDALSADLRVVLCADATAAVTEALHEGALSNVRYGIGEVMTAHAALQRLGMVTTP